MHSPKQPVVLVCIIAVALVLRLWNVSQTRNVDEPNVIENAVIVADGTRHVPWYNWPAQSLIGVNGVVLHVARPIAAREFTTVIEWYTSDSQTVRTIAHSLTAVFGAIGVLLAFGVATRVTRSTIAGYIAAFLLAFNYLHALHSKFATPDVPLVAAVLAALWSALGYIDVSSRRQQRQWAIGAGAIVGFAVATKYTGALVVVPLAIALVMRVALRPAEWKAVLQDSGIIVISALVMHTVCNPFALFDWHSVRDALAQEASPFRLGVDWGGQDHVFWKNALYYLRSSLAWNGTVISIVGWCTMLWGLAVIRTPIGRRISVLTATYVATLIGLSTLGLHWSRWSLPLTACIVPAAAIGFFMLARALYHWRNTMLPQWVRVSVCAVVFVIVVFPQVLLTVVQAATASAPQTSQRLSAYLQEIAPEGAVVVADGYFIEPGPQFTVSQPGTGLYDTPLSTYVTQGVDYVVVKKGRKADAKKQPERYQHILDFYEALEASATPIHTFRAQRGDPILDHKRDYAVYQWLWQHQWNTLLHIEDGDTYILYDIQSN